MKKNGFLFFLLLTTLSSSLWAQSLSPVRIKKLNPAFSSYPFGFINFNGAMYFFASRSELQNDNVSLWKSDGSEEGTQMVKDSVGYYTKGVLPQIQILNNQMYFLTNQNSADSLFLTLWKSDGTESGTQVLLQSGRDLSGGDFYVTGQLEPFNGKLYFNFYDSTGGTEPFFTDGTVAGTGLLKDLQTEFYGFNGTPSFPHRFTVAGNNLYFWALPFINGFGLKARLYKTDGTAANTVVVKEFGGGFSQVTFLSHLVPFQNRLYFSAQDSPGSGFELWSSDGTTAGTNLVKEINSGSSNAGNSLSPVFQGQTFRNRLYFYAFDPGSGHELWSSDGTNAGTTLVKNTHSSSIPSLNTQAYNSQPFFVFGSKMYYANNDGTKGRELWVTDGSSAGTRIFNDINPGSFGSIGLWNPGFTVFEGKMYFRAFDGTTHQICRADTANQTVETFPVVNSYFSAEIPYDFQLADAERFVLHPFNGELYFPAGFDLVNLNPVAVSHDFGKLAVVPNSVVDTEKAPVARIFPNPGNGIFHLERSAHQASGSVILLNHLGRKVWAGRLDEGQTRISLDLRLLPAGMYFLRFPDSGQEHSLRLFIH